MLRCAASFVIAAYAQVRLIPHDLRALPQPAPAEAGEAFYKTVPFSMFLPLFTRASKMVRDKSKGLRLKRSPLQKSNLD
jgi:hypothetical protein